MARDQFSVIFGNRRGLRVDQEEELFVVPQAGVSDPSVFSPDEVTAKRLLRVLDWWHPGSKVDFSAETLGSDVPAYREIDATEDMAREDLELLTKMGLCKKMTTSLAVASSGMQLFTSYALKELDEWPEEHRRAFIAYTS